MYFKLKNDYKTITMKLQKLKYIKVGRTRVKRLDTNMHNL